MSFVDHIRQFQREEGLVVDGIAGPTTKQMYYRRYPFSTWVPESGGTIYWDYSSRLFRGKLTESYIRDTAIAFLEQAPVAVDGLTADDLVALVAVESAFDTAAVSSTGHVGLTQLGPLAVTEVYHHLSDPTFGGVVGYTRLPRGRFFLSDPYDPVQNLTVGWSYYGLQAQAIGMRFPKLHLERDLTRELPLGLRAYFAFVYGINNYPAALQGSSVSNGKRSFTANLSPGKLAGAFLANHGSAPRLV